MVEGVMAAAVGADVKAAAPATLQAGYGVSLSDLGAFEQALANADGSLQTKTQAGETSAIGEIVTQPLDFINGEAVDLNRFADATAAAGTNLTPGEMIQLTVRCEQFMFHCQLTSNIANRASDGLQQLFRQQS